MFSINDDLTFLLNFLVNHYWLLEDAHFTGIIVQYFNEIREYYLIVLVITVLEITLTMIILVIDSQCSCESGDFVSKFANLKFVPLRDRWRLDCCSYSSSKKYSENGFNLVSWRVIGCTKLFNNYNMILDYKV